MTDRAEAKALLRGAGVTSSQSFDSLNDLQRLTIVDEAKSAYLRKHGKLMPDGSDGFIRKRFDLLQRRARC